MTAPEPETGPQPGPEPEASDLFWGAPTPHDLGLTSNSDLSWEAIGIAEPTPHDLGRSNDPDLSWEGFQAERDPARIQADPEPELEAEL